jgi:hypothetical protein
MLGIEPSSDVVQRRTARLSLARRRCRPQGSRDLPTGVLAGLRVQLAVGTAALLVPAMAVRRNRVGPGEPRGGCQR